MTVDMLYACYGDRIRELIDNIPRSSEKLKIIIIHQTETPEKYLDIVSSINEFPHLTYVHSYERGVTKSRNLAISKSTSDIILFCDDDVTYEPDIYEVLIESYSINPDFEVLTFAYKKENLEGFGRFSKKSYIHNRKTILSVGTIEVSCKRTFIQSKNIKFPLNLGAGSQYYLCDEPVFMSRVLDNGGKAKYIPLQICSHPEVSSGQNFNDINALRSRLICFHYIFGKLLGTFIYNIFIIKNIYKLNFKQYYNAFVKVYGY